MTREGGTVREPADSPSAIGRAPDSAAALSEQQGPVELRTRQRW